MIPQHILEQLVTFTDEEINHLNGIDTIDKSIYINEASHVIDYMKLLQPGQMFSVRKHARFCEYPKHKHNYIELMYVYGGSMTHHIQDYSITLNEGELLLMNQNIEHSIECCYENDIIFNFIIQPEFLTFLVSLLDKESEISRFIFDILYSYDNDGECLVFKSSHNVKVKSYVEAIIMALYTQSLNQEMELKLLVGLLLTELMNEPEHIESYTSDSYEKILGTQVLKYIHFHYRDGSLAHLSDDIHQPDYKICKLIKNQTGKTFTQLLQDEKMNVATRLLRTTHMTIEDILHEVGYENASYFYRLFKKKYHMTPQLYKNQFAKKDSL